MLPTFILAGTLPAGSGHLYGLLRQHPEVYLAEPMQPECNFFFKTREYERGLEYYAARWFARVGGQRAIGERSTLLLSGAWVPARVAQHLPNVKLVFMLRNPVDRAYANYRFTVLAGYEDLGFEEALEREEERRAEANRDPFWGEIQPQAYFRRGLYAEQLSPWLGLFPRAQLYLMRSDALLRNQAEALRQLYRFLGVSESFVAADVPPMSSPAVRDAARQAQLRREFASDFDQGIQRLRHGTLGAGPLDGALRENLQPSDQPLSAELRRALTWRFAEANRQLAPLVPFDISDWLP